MCTLRNFEFVDKITANKYGERLRIIKDKFCTFFWCLRTKLKYNSTWVIRGKLIVVRPNFFHKPSHVRIGDYFHAQASLKWNLYGIIQPNVLNVRSPNANLIIGDNVGISGSTICATGTVTIGNNVLIGSGCIISDTDAHPIHPLDRNDNIKAKAYPIHIEDDVFIGARCIILKGVRIGHGSVIGAGSVVTKDIPPMCIAAGNPARIINYL